MYPYHLIYSLFSNESLFSTKIIGTGCYLPEKCISNEDLITEINNDELQQKYDREVSYGRINKGLTLAEFISKHYGIYHRYRANDKETNSFMGAEACKNALKSANMTIDNIDLLLYAAASMDEIIPDTSTRIHNILKLNDVPSFTIHSTCISFMHAMNVADAFIKNGTYRTIMIISPEKLSLTTNPNDIKTHVIMGDLASAVILQRNNTSELSSHIISTEFATYGSFSDKIKCNVGNIMHPCTNNYCKEDYYFKTESMSLVNQLPSLVAKFLSRLVVHYDHIVIHQPSKIAVDHAKQMFDDKIIVETFDKIGNCAAATIPYNLHTLISNGKVKRGETILIVGLGAGIGVGCINLRY